MRLLLVSTLILSSFCSAAFADDPKITGSFAINEDKSIGFQVDGEAAKALFNGMKAKAVREECTGGMEKNDASGLHCIKNDDGTYNCDFGYDFKAKKFSGSGQDC